MTAYYAILSARFRTLLQYRAAALAGFGTQLFWGLIRLMIFEAFYRSSSAPQPMRLDEVITYLWLGQAMFAMMPYTVTPDADVKNMIRSGTVAYELVRPLDLYTLWYSRLIAGRIAPTLLRAIPMFVVAMLFFGMRFPPSPASALAWVLTTFGALLLGCALSNLVTVSLLWTISGEGISRAAPSLVFLFSGMLVPLPFFPDWAQPIVNFLPFRGMVDVPFRLYTGNIPPSQAGASFAHQMAWTLAFVLVGRALLARGARRLVVQGG